MASEPITDIQNYLQTFNKEIGEESSQANANQTFYAIDTSQVIATGASSSDGAQVVVTQTTAGGDANGSTSAYQTVALVPDGNSGGYVLIVQPTNQQGQVTIPTTVALEDAQAASSTANLETDENSEEVNKESNGDDADATENEAGNTNNSISVYDFEEGQSNAIAVPEIVNETEMNQSDELTNNEKSITNTTTNSTATGKGTKRTRKSQGNSTASTKKSKSANSTGNSAQPNAASSLYQCNYCSYTSNKRYLLSRHMKSHSEDRPHKCGICERGFKTMASLNNHVNTHTGVKPHACKYCDSAFTTSGELVRHVRYRHTHEKPHRCTECDYASVELSKLKRHLRCHTGERPYQCQHCTYASPDTYKLKRHLRIHTGEKPYQCEVCQARFTQSNSLKAHRLIHSGNKPVFKCSLCPTTCGRKTDLRIHVQKLHTSEKPLVCKRCDQNFPDRYSFKQHLKTHEGEKCFKCDLCSYASVSARHLESHMLIHTDKKPFMCDECEQSFRQKQLLKRHKNLYHNPEYIPPQPKEKTHECPNCSKAFRHKGNLMRHLALHDPDSYKDQPSLRSNDNHQLIDEEEDEDTILPSFNVDESTTLDSQALHLTFDPQSQQMLNGEQVVVFEVVQVNENSGVNSEDGQQYATIDGEQVAISTQKLKTATVGKGSNLKAVSIDNENYIIQLQSEDDQAANQIEDNNTIVDEAPTNNISGKNSKFEKSNQNDISNCFGFKDEDDDDH